jgi:hypothetical protein
MISRWRAMCCSPSTTWRSASSKWRRSIALFIIQSYYGRPNLLRRAVLADLCQRSYPLLACNASYGSSVCIETPDRGRFYTSHLRQHRWQYRERRRRGLRLGTVAMPEARIEQAIARGLLKPEDRVKPWAVISRPPMRLAVRDSNAAA